MQQLTVIAEFGAKEHAIHRFGRNNTIRDVKAFWAQQSQSKQQVSVKTIENAVLPNEAKISELPFLDEECPIVYLNIKEFEPDNGKLRV